LVAGAHLALIGTVITLSVVSIMHRLQESLLRARDLTEELDIQRAQQEHRILQRTQDIERRLGQIRNASEIIRATGFYLKPEQLLPKMVELIKERFNFYFVGVYILDEGGEFAVLQAGTGEAGAAMLEAGQRITVDDTSNVGWAIHNRKPRIASDVGFEAVRFNNPLLPLTRSELAIPLVTDRENGSKILDNSISTDLNRHRVLGAMIIQSTEAKAFDQDIVNVLQELADALVTALENVRLFQQLERSLEEIRTLYRQYLLEAWKETSHEVENRQFVTDAH
jgi:GAF domain-containing protein